MQPAPRLKCAPCDPRVFLTAVVILECLGIARGVLPGMTLFGVVHPGLYRRRSPGWRPRGRRPGRGGPGPWVGFDDRRVCLGRHLRWARQPGRHFWSGRRRQDRLGASHLVMGRPIHWRGVGRLLAALSGGRRHWVGFNNRFIESWRGRRSAQGNRGRGGAHFLPGDRSLWQRGRWTEWQRCWGCYWPGARHGHPHGRPAHRRLDEPGAQLWAGAGAAQLFLFVDLPGGPAAGRRGRGFAP